MPWLFFSGFAGMAEVFHVTLCMPLCRLWCHIELRMAHDEDTADAVWHAAGTGRVAYDAPLSVIYSYIILNKSK